MKLIFSSILFFILAYNSNSLKAQTGRVNSNIKAYNQISFKIRGEKTPMLTKAIAVFNRLTLERSGVDLASRKSTGKKLLITLYSGNNKIKPEGFKIMHPGENEVFIEANGDNGILYGLGKLLHSSTFAKDGLLLNKWAGVSVPDKQIRGMYFSTHNHNFYQDAPIQKVLNYVEELAMWGINGLEVWFDMHNYEGINDPSAQEMLDRLSAILKAGRQMGMKTCLTILGNEGYKSSPVNLRADGKTKRGHYHVEICPSLPGGTELILAQVNDELDEFIKRSAPIDHVIIWPYDEGGCACSLCKPWGANGYLKISERISALVRHKLPSSHLTLSTWLFDYKTDQGEWSGLASAFKSKKPWVDYILADSHGTFPEYLLKNPVPGNLPLLNFPEISMWGAWPWGVYGATPLPKRFQELWNSISSKVIGGYPYSEGIYEDINKIIFSQFYWDRDKTADQALTEYISFEFSPLYVNKIKSIMEILEANHGMSTAKWALVPGSPKRFVYPEKDHGSELAYRMAKEVDQQLPEQIRKSWRWRILLIRTMLDYEIRMNKGIPNAEAEAGFRELLEIFHADHGDVRVRPPVNYGERYPINKTVDGPSNDKN